MEQKGKEFFGDHFKIEECDHHLKKLEQEKENF